MTLQGRFVVLVVLALGMIAGCGNPFWDGASASYFQNGGDAQDPDDTGFDDGAVQQDAPDVRMGDATPPVDQGSDATPSEDRVDTGAFADALDTGDVGQDATFADVVGDEGLVLVDVPLTEDVADAGSAPDVLEDAFAPLDTAIPVDTAPSLDVGQDVGADVGFDATSVATDGGDAGPSDTGPTCPSGQTLCGGSCISTASSVDHCGACGNACGMSIFPNMGRVCQSGQCGDVCVTGFANCDGTMGNGCEVDTRLNTQHCGACMRACVLPNATPACLAGSCYIASCVTSFASCDSNEANGCEVDTRTNAQHCGACGRVCVSPANGTASCFNGVCSSRCDDGYAFNTEGSCVRADLVVEYVAQLYSWYTVPGQLIRLTESVYGIRVGFPGDGYRARACDAIPTVFTREGRQWWRCVIRSVPSVDAVAASLLLSVDSPCGFMSGLSCPDRWNEHWRVVLRGRVYESPRDVARFTQSSSCPYGGWMSGCVHLRLTP